MESINPYDLVLWHDDQVLIVNKPPGLPTLVDGFNPQAPYLAGLIKLVFDPIWIVHRLDKETSGVMVFALTASAHKSLNTQFEKRKIFKIYHALVIGNCSWKKKTTYLPLVTNGDRKHRTVINMRQGKPSSTEFRVMERFVQNTLVEAIPRSGRTHQIRAHLAALGYPLAVDHLYGDGQPILSNGLKNHTIGKKGNETSLLGRIGLHAHSITFMHPVSDQILEFEAPYPPDLTVTLMHLRSNFPPNNPC